MPDHLPLRCAPTHLNIYHALCFCFLYAFSLASPHTQTIPFIEILKLQFALCSLIYLLYPNTLLHILLLLLVLVLSVTSIMASRAVLLLAMCVLPAMVVAIRPAKNPFCVKGRVYCDPCRAGFETSATTYIAGNC